MKSKSVFTPPLTGIFLLGPEAHMCYQVSTTIQSFSSDDEDINLFNY